MCFGHPQASQIEPHELVGVNDLRHVRRFYLEFKFAVFILPLWCHGTNGWKLWRSKRWSPFYPARKGVSKAMNGTLLENSAIAVVRM
jgi:hypothetical protein